MSNKRPGQNQNVPTYPELIRQGYCDRYYDTDQPELMEAYKQLKETNPDGYKELMDMDYRQGRRDYIYEDNKSYQPPELESYTPHEPLDHLFPSTDKGRYLLAVANLLSKGYNQVEIAELHGVSKSSVGRVVAEIRVIMAGE